MRHKLERWGPNQRGFGTFFLMILGAAVLSGMLALVLLKSVLEGTPFAESAGPVSAVVAVLVLGLITWKQRSASVEDARRRKALAEAAAAKKVDSAGAGDQTSS